MDLGFDLVVTITGMVLVFFILILLMLVISVEGKFFDSRDAKKKAAAVQKASEQKGPTVKAADAAPSVESGIPAHIVAVIAAAVAVLSGGRYKLRAVRRADEGARGSWGKAGVLDVTAPF